LLKANEYFDVLYDAFFSFSWEILKQIELCLSQGKYFFVKKMAKQKPLYLSADVNLQF